MNKLTQNQINKIKQKILIGSDKLIIRLNVSGDKNISINDNNGNIYCINETYEILWQIDAPNTDFERDSFVNIELINGKLLARRFSGFEYLINTTSGVAEKIGWDK